MQPTHPSAEPHTRRPQLWPEPTTEAPDDEDLEAMCIDSVVDATDGCSVEPDGVCAHGHPSWLLHLGLI